MNKSYFFFMNVYCFTDRKDQALAERYLDNGVALYIGIKPTGYEVNPKLFDDILNLYVWCRNTITNEVEAFKRINMKLTDSFVHQLIHLKFKYNFKKVIKDKK